jgi:hypothetical protein
MKKITDIRLYCLYLSNYRTYVAKKRLRRFILEHAKSLPPKVALELVSIRDLLKPIHEMPYNQ